MKIGGMRVRINCGSSKARFRDKARFDCSLLFSLSLFFLFHSYIRDNQSAQRRRKEKRRGKRVCEKKRVPSRVSMNKKYWNEIIFVYIYIYVQNDLTDILNKTLKNKRWNCIKVIQRRMNCVYNLQETMATNLTIDSIYPFYPLRRITTHYRLRNRG